MVSNLLYRYHFVKRYIRRIRNHHHRLSRHILRCYFWSILFSGIVWAAIVPFAHYLPLEYYFFVYSVVLVLTLASITSIGPMIPFYSAFVTPMNLAMLIDLLSRDDPVYTIAAFAQIVTYLSSFKFSSVRLKEYEKVIRENLRIQKLKEHFESLARYDTLTELPNRFSFFEIFEEKLKKARKNEKKVGLLFLDLDRFKSINDTYGHATGDEVLRTVGKRLEKAVVDRGIPSRLAGDEFVIILPEIRCRDTLLQEAERIREILGEPLTVDGGELPIDVSIGVVLYPDDGENADLLLKRADMAMYLDKRNGSPRSTPAIPKQETPALPRRKIKRD
jgi:diguanylate cyclase (GGDEF)-like protein